MRFYFILILLIAVSCSKQRKEESRSENISTEEIVIPKAEDTESSHSSVEIAKSGFKPLRLLSGKVRMQIPSELQPMDADIFHLKYPMENLERTTAYGNDDATVTLLISSRQEDITQKDLPKYKKMFYETFGTNPSIEVKKNEIRKINGKDFIVLEMITPAFDTNVYNLIFVTNLEGKLLMSTFNCTVEKVKKWQPLGEVIVSSVRITD